jgi:hypothetical protein
MMTIQARVDRIAVKPHAEGRDVLARRFAARPAHAGVAGDHDPDRLEQDPQVDKPRRCAEGVSASSRSLPRGRWQP